MLLSQHATGIFPTHFFLPDTFHRYILNKNLFFRSCNRVSILWCIAPIPTLFASSQHARKGKKQPATLTPHIYHFHPLIEFAGAKIAPNQRTTYTSPFSSLIPSFISRAAPFTSGPRPNDSSFLLFSRCIRLNRPLLNIPVVRSGPASHYGSDLIRTYYRQGEIISGHDVAFCFPIIVIFIRYASSHVATARF